MRRFLSQCSHYTKTLTVPMKLKELTKQFQHNNVTEAQTSGELIISHVLGKKSFSQLLGNERSRLLTDGETDLINKLRERRMTHLPIQYVIEEWDFGGLTLKMRPPVFIPRPETEDLVNFVIKDINSSSRSSFNLLEVGCGSGAITLALLHALRQGRISKQLKCTAIDKNEQAVLLTSENAKAHNLSGSNINVVHCDVKFLSVIGRFDGIVSNPPYIPTNEMEDLQPEIAKYESEMALRGGKDGLDVVREIVNCSENLLKRDGWIWLEVDTSHPKVIGETCKKVTLREVEQDFLGRDRFVHLVPRQS